MFTKYAEKHFIVTALAICMMAVTFVGCQKTGAEGPAVAAKPKVPSFTFHKPKEFGAAVVRMRKLHDAIMSEDPLPAPIEYQVKEVVHGEGEAGHSHYFLHDGDDEAGEAAAHDGHETTGENILNVSVGPFVEQKDIFRWLPKIASAGDMPESEWTKVNEISKELTPKLYKIIESSYASDDRRASYRECAEAVSNHIATLEELAK